MSDRGESQSSGIATVEQAMAELDRREAARAEQSEADQAEPEQVEAEEPEQDQEPEATDDEGEEVAPDSEEAPEPEAPATVDFDGKALAIPKGTPKALVEAVQKLGNDLKADYTRKTQEVANQRSAIEQAKTAVAQNFQQMQQQAQALAMLGRELLGEEPSLELAQQDPQEYLVRKGLFERRAQQLNALMAQQQQAQMRQQQEFMQAQQTRLQEEFPKLLQAMPELQDPGKKSAFTQKATDVATGYGFTADDVTQTTDHRVLLMLRDLAEFKALKAQMAQAKAKVAKAPPKAFQAGPSTPVREQSSQRMKEAKQQFLKSDRSDKALREWIRKTS